MKLQSLARQIFTKKSHTVLRFTVLNVRIIFSHSEHESDDERPPSELFSKSLYPPLYYSQVNYMFQWTSLFLLYCKLHKINVNFEYVCYYFIQLGSGHITLLLGGGVTSSPQIVVYMLRSIIWSGVRVYFWSGNLGSCIFWRPSDASPTNHGSQLPPPFLLLHCLCALYFLSFILSFVFSLPCFVSSFLPFPSS